MKLKYAGGDADGDAGSEEDLPEFPPDLLTLDGYLSSMKPSDDADADGPTASARVRAKPGPRVEEGVVFGPGRLLNKRVFGIDGVLATCYHHKPDPTHTCNKWFSFAKDGQKTGVMKAKAWILSWDVQPNTCSTHKFQRSWMDGWDFADPTGTLESTMDALAVGLGRPDPATVIPDTILALSLPGPSAAVVAPSIVAKAKAKGKAKALSLPGPSAPVAPVAAPKSAAGPADADAKSDHEDNSGAEKSSSGRSSSNSSSSTSSGSD